MLQPVGGGRGDLSGLPRGAPEERLGGVCVIRTSLNEETLGDRDVARAYRSPAGAERAFRSLQSFPDLSTLATVELE